MKPVRLGDRGPAVEDIQRRLRLLGYDLGPTGVDGVFFGRTADAVRAFRVGNELDSDTVVDDVTWALLVDATFMLGDRMLYLKTPYFHGHDVRVLQEALSALGFACGAADGIFGPFTESAVREYQRNVGLVGDGIVGAETVRSLLLLRHMWQGKEPKAHSQARGVPARRCTGLLQIDLHVSGLDTPGQAVADRLVNLALATSPDARVRLGPSDERGEGFELLLCGLDAAPGVPGRPVVSERDDETLESRLLTAVESTKRNGASIVVELAGVTLDTEHKLQREAVRLLDALCAVFDGARAAW